MLRTISYLLVRLKYHSLLVIVSAFIKGHLKVDQYVPEYYTCRQ